MRILSQKATFSSYKKRLRLLLTASHLHRSQRFCEFDPLPSKFELQIGCHRIHSLQNHLRIFISNLQQLTRILKRIKYQVSVLISRSLYSPVFNTLVTLLSSGSIGFSNS